MVSISRKKSLISPNNILLNNSLVLGGKKARSIFIKYKTHMTTNCKIAIFNYNINYSIMIKKRRLIAIKLNRNGFEFASPISLFDICQLGEDYCQ